MTAPGGSLRVALFADRDASRPHGVGGAVDRLVRAIRARGGDARLFAPPGPLTEEPLAETEVVDGIPFWAYPEHRRAGPDRSRTASVLSAWRPTLVHLASPSGIGLAGRAAARALGLPFVTSFRPGFVFGRAAGFGALRGPSWAFLRWFHNGGARTYCSSRAAVLELRRQGFERLALWSGGVDLASFDPGLRSRAMRERLGADDDTIVVAHAGPTDDASLALGARTVMLVQQTTARRVVWALAADAGALDRLREPAPADTVCVGPLEGAALGELFASADIGFAPCAGDAPDETILQAMASGLPILAASSATARELVGETRGATATAGDAEAMALRLISLIGDARERDVLRANALGFARRRSWDIVLDDMVASYERVARDLRARRASTSARFLDTPVDRPRHAGLADVSSAPESRPTYSPRGPDAAPRA